MKALQINDISLTEDTEPSLPVWPAIKLYHRYISSICCCYFKLILFFCDLNFLHEYSNSRGFIFAKLKTREIKYLEFEAGARYFGPRPRTVPCLVYIQGRGVNSEREAIELRKQAVLVVLECRYFGKYVFFTLKYWVISPFWNWLIKGRFFCCLVHRAAGRI